MSLSKEAKTLREWTDWCHNEAVRQAKEHKFKETANIELVALDVAQRILDTEIASHLDSFAKERLEREQKLRELLKTCPLVPNLEMLSVGERSKLLGEHSVQLDEWYKKVKRELLK